MTRCVQCGAPVQQVTDFNVGNRFEYDDRLLKAYLQLVKLIEYADTAAVREGDGEWTYFYNLPCGPWHKIIGAIRKPIADNAIDYDQGQFVP